LFAANDAYMRDFELIVPRDCVAANRTDANERTLRYIERLLKADTSASTELRTKKLHPFRVDKETPQQAVGEFS